MPNVETNLTKPFPVVFSGHTLKYEIECICKIFLPIRKFTFLYDTAQLPEDAEEGAVLTLECLSRLWKPLLRTGSFSLSYAILSKNRRRRIFYVRNRRIF